MLGDSIKHVSVKPGPSLARRSCSQHLSNTHHGLPAGVPDTQTHPTQASARHTDTPNPGQCRTHRHTQPRPATGAGVSREWSQRRARICPGSGARASVPGRAAHGSMGTHGAQPGLADGVCLEQSHLRNQSVQVTGRKQCEKSDLGQEKLAWGTWAGHWGPL